MRAMTTKISAITITIGTKDIELTLEEAQDLRVALNDLFKVEKGIQPVYVPMPDDHYSWKPFYSSDKLTLCCQFITSNTWAKP